LAPLLLEEHGVNLLLQGGDHGEELFFTGWWWWLAGGGCLGRFPLWLLLLMQYIV